MQVTCTDKRIQNIVQHMYPQSNRRTDCPECGGTRCLLVSKKTKTTGQVYCFRASCQYSAVVNLPELSLQESLASRRAMLQAPVDIPRIPADCFRIDAMDNGYNGTGMSGTPRAPLAVEWVCKAGLLPQECGDVGFSWSPSMHAVAIPCMEQERLQGVLYRPLPGKGGPKYILRHNRAQGALWAPLGAFPEKSPVVLVEDVLSCLRLRKIGYPAVACLGTYCNDSIMSHMLLLDPTKVILWLDGDKAGKAGVARFRRKLSLMGIAQHSVMVEGKDPKHLTNRELHAALQPVL